MTLEQKIQKAIKITLKQFKKTFKDLALIDKNEKLR